MSSQLVELVPASLDMTAFEEAFQHEIACDHCNEPAQWRSFGHKEDDCGASGSNDNPPYHKCTACHTGWREWLKKALDSFGCIKCAGCVRMFDTIEEFSDYRRF